MTIISKRLWEPQALSDPDREFADQSPVPNPPSRFNLIQRERDVLQLLVNGLSDRQFANQLSISSRTVGGHITNLLSKLDVESRTAAATFAVRQRLV